MTSRNTMINLKKGNKIPHTLIKQAFDWLLLKFKGYLHYKPVTSQNVLSEAQVKSFFIS